MDLSYLKKILKIFDDSSLTEMLIEEEGIKVKLTRNKDNGKVQSTLYPQPNLYQPNYIQESSQQIQNNDTKSINNNIDKNNIPQEPAEAQHIINSPIIGTFYRAPSPESPVFVEVGTHIIPGTTLCIVEAMKLMNEIESDVSGTIVKILVENQHPVEFSQPLFIVKPD